LAPRNNAPAPQLRTDERGPVFSQELSPTLQLALAYAKQRKHQYTTLEHLLLALIDDVHASAAMNACKVDLGALKSNLTNYIDNDLKALVTDDGESTPTAAFQRVIRAPRQMCSLRAARR
jgi:ATP-dependent Clp protease ATP-binding subunit ClpA